MIEDIRGRAAFAAAATIGLGVMIASIVTWSPDPEPDQGALVADSAPVGSPAPSPEVEPSSEEVAVATRPTTTRQRIEDRRSYVVVVGDAFATGSTLEGAPTWPTLLGRRNAWEVRTIASDDAGYVVGGADRFLAGDATARLRRYPADLVVIAGGAADLADGRVDLADDVSRVVRQVRRTLPDSDVLLTSPFAPGRPTARATEMTTAMRVVADREGVAFLDLSRLFTKNPELLDDGVPTATGQRRIARAVDRRTTARAWPRYDAWLDPAA